jgi:hypothetical protein
MTQTLTTEEELNGLANHIAGAKGGLPQEWQDWATEIETDLRKLANREAQPAGFYTTVSGRKGVVWHNGAPEDDTAIYTAPPAPVSEQPVFCVDMDSDFIKHIQKCSEAVAKWPEWKRQGADATQFTAPPVVSPEFTGAPHLDSITLETSRAIMYDVDRRGDFPGGACQLQATLQYHIETACRAAMLAQPVSQSYKLPPHAYRELVNYLRDTAVKYSGTDQLRERLNTALSQFIEPDHPHTRTSAPEGGNDEISKG